MVEVLTHSPFLTILRDELPKRLPDYRRTTPQQRSREMQRAAFGDVRKVTEDEYEELINTVRDIREWLKENGNLSQDRPDEEGTVIPVYSLEDSPNLAHYSVRVILAPHEQSAGRNREPYPKFSFELHGEDGYANFDLNFDDTYNLEVRAADARDAFEIVQLNRRNMTKPEHDFVMGCIGKVASHFGIPLR